MGLGGNIIGTWEEMKKTFLGKYQDYCKEKDHKEEIFRMSQKEDKSLEYYVEWVNYNLQWSRKVNWMKGPYEFCF
jgi:hypothetical protein